MSLVALIGMAILSYLAITNSPTGGSASWPPIAHETRNRFFEHREELEVLAQMISDAPYTMVFRRSDGSVIAFPVDREGSESVEPDSPQVWSDLFATVNRRSVSKFKGTLTLDNRFEVEGPIDGVAHSYSYVKFGERDSIECLPQLAGSQCGVCDERLDDEWRIFFTWFNADWLEGVEEMDVIDEAEFDELMEQNEIKINSCLGDFFEKLDFTEE